MSFRKYLTRKPIHELLKDARESTFDRTLGAFQLILMGIGAIIGAGIFVIAGSAAGQHAGPAITLSFAIGGIASAFAGLCYAELSSTIPSAGGAYTFAYATLGELFAWLIFGMILLTYLAGAASVASGWSGYIISFLADYGIVFPAEFIHTTGSIITFEDGHQGVGLVNIPALLIVAALTAVVYRGAESAAWVNTAIVAIKMFVLSLFIVIGSFFIDFANWVPFLPENTGVPGEFGVSGIITGAAVTFLAFTGFDAVATAAQEAKNPQRSLPIGILVSLLICTIFYIAISGVLTGIVPYTKLNVAQPMALAVDKMQMPWFSVLIKIGAVTGLTSVILVLIFGAVRIIYTVVHDGLLPQFLSKCHSKFHTPHILTIATGCIIAVLSTMVPIDKLVKLANLGTLSTFATVCFATIYMRYKMPEVERGFKCPLFPFVPIAGILLFTQIIWGLPAETFKHVAIWIVILLIVYATYSRFNSKLLKEIDKGEVEESLD